MNDEVIEVLQEGFIFVGDKRFANGKNCKYIPPEALHNMILDPHGMEYAQCFGQYSTTNPACEECDYACPCREECKESGGNG